MHTFLWLGCEWQVNKQTRTAAGAGEDSHQPPADEGDVNAVFSPGLAAGDWDTPDTS